MSMLGRGLHAAPRVPVNPSRTSAAQAAELAPSPPEPTEGFAVGGERAVSVSLRAVVRGGVVLVLLGLRDRDLGPVQLGRRVALADGRSDGISGGRRAVHPLSSGRVFTPGKLLQRTGSGSSWSRFLSW